MKKAFGAVVLAMSLVASVCWAQDPNVLIEQPLTWSVNSVQIVWSVEEGGVSEAKTDYLFNAEQGRDKKTGRDITEGDKNSSTSGHNMGGKLGAQAQLSANPATLFGLLGAHVSGSAYTDYNTASESGTSSSDVRQWSDSESQTVRSVLSSSTSDTGMRKIANRRLVFSVDFINHTKSRLIVVDGTGTVPVYCSDVHIGDAQLVAEEKSKATTIAPTHKPISCRFEMPLNDTGKELLLTKRPVIKIGGGQLIIQSEDGKIKDAIPQSMTFPPHFTISVLSEDMQTDWQILCDDDGVSVVTLREALEAINKRVRLQLNAGRSKRVFDIENSRVCNQQINAKNADWTVQIVRIQDEETPIKTLAEILDTKPEMGDKIQFRIISNEIEKLQKSGDNGNAKALFELGYKYYTGDGVAKNPAEAVKWYRKAADQGLAAAQNALGDCYFNGVGVGQNEREAVKWYRKAAVQGLAEAQCTLGNCYYMGTGVKKDNNEAVKWYRKAADQGIPDAQYDLGLYYKYGEGVEKNFTEAVKWFRKAADQGYMHAQYELGWCYKSGKGVEKNFTEAAKWFRKAADQGLADAQCDLGTCYWSGYGVEKDEREAVKWFRKAADQGFADAQHQLGLCYYLGVGVAKDYDEAVKWYRKAAEQGYAMAQYDLGLCYENGNGVAKDLTEAKKWYRKAADQGYEYAIKRLGY